MQVRCHGCHAQFRLTPRRTSVAITELPCPACNAIIHVQPYPLVRKSVDNTPGFGKTRREREEAIVEEPVSGTLLDGEEQGWTRVSLGALFNRPNEAPPRPERPGPRAEPTSLQNRFRPVATDENVESEAAATVSNLGVFGQITQKETAGRAVTFEEPPESVDSFAIPPPAPAVELVRNAKRLPETDKPDDVHPLAAVLLKQLREKRSHAPTPRTVAAVAGVASVPAHEHKQSAGRVAAEVDADPALPAVFDAIFDDVFDLDSAFDASFDAESIVSAPATADVVSPVQEPDKRIELAAQPIVIIEAPPVHPGAPKELPVFPVFPISPAPVRVAQAPARSVPEVASSEVEISSESAVRAEVETEVEVERLQKRPQPGRAIFAGLLIATAVASALAVHVYHSKAVPVVEERPAPVVFSIREPGEVDLAKLRSLWSAIAVASEVVNGSTRQTARQKILGLIETGMSERAHRMILDQVQTTGVTPESQALFDMNLRADPRLDYPLITIVPNANASVIVDSEEERRRNITSIDELRALGGGHSVSFRMTRGGKNLYAFKPDQRVWQGGWRTEVAAYQLCFIMVCHFTVPENRAARISRSDFETMYAQITTEKQRNYAERFDELIWESEPNADGSVTEYLYGTLKEWIPQFVLWPIEYEDIWQPWVDHAADPALLDVPLREAIAPLKNRLNGSFYTGILREQSGATTRSLAQQVSTLLVFDYVTNNHDRFSLVEDYYGVNNHFADGNFMSIDNGAAFQFQAMQKIQTRFDPVTRFSRSTIDSLRLMRPEAVSEILFPETIPAENLRLEVFWQQRKRLLERVDALIKEHGESEILFFD